MNRERDPFDLRSLPPLPSPKDDWPHIALALRQRHKRRQATVWLSTAAVLALTVGLAWQVPNPAPRAAVTAQDNLESLIGLSQQLERNLRLVRSEIDAMSAQSVVYQVELEDLVAQVDDALSLKPDSRELWSQRVNLLLDLEQLYQRELRRDYGNLASL